MAILPFLTDTLNDETFNELYLCCSEVKLYRPDFEQRVYDLVIKKRKKIAAENTILYGRRNILLNHTIGNTAMLASDRVILTDWDEWGR